MKYFYIIPVFLLMTSVYSQDDPILKSQQNAISSMSLVDALASRIPGAKKLQIDQEIKILLLGVDNLLTQLVMRYYGRLMELYTQIPLCLMQAKLNMLKLKLG